MSEAYRNVDNISFEYISEFFGEEYCTSCESMSEVSGDEDCKFCVNISESLVNHDSVFWESDSCKVVWI